MKKIRAVLVLAWALAVLLPTGAQEAEFKSTFREEMLAMRDGVKLATNIFLPEGRGPWPAVLQRTPYGKDGRGKDKVPGSGRNQAVPYAARGYALVVQDTRGTGRSEGENVPFRMDQHDGHDTVEWVARQPWCNGTPNKEPTNLICARFGVQPSGCSPPGRLKPELRTSEEAKA